MDIRFSRHLAFKGSVRIKAANTSAPSEDTIPQTLAQRMHLVLQSFQLGDCQQADNQSLTCGNRLTWWKGIYSHKVSFDPHVPAHATPSPHSHVCAHAENKHTFLKRQFHMQQHI